MKFIVIAQVIAVIAKTGKLFSHVLCERRTDTRPLVSNLQALQMMIFGWKIVIVKKNVYLCIHEY